MTPSHAPARGGRPAAGDRREAAAPEDLDLLGIGFGPANIALAVAIDEMKLDASVQFLEREAAPDWQPEMLLDGSDTQHHPLRDFVTPRNPRSPYGFLSYLHGEGRLFEFLNLGLEFPLRKDYARYVRWVARSFDRWVSYGEAATSIRLDADGGDRFIVETTLGRRLRARAISFGPGRSPFVPREFQACRGGRVAHFTRFASALARWSVRGAPAALAVVGSSQSAAEIVLDLSSRLPDTHIFNVHRSYSYQLKDVSPFTERVYFPDFVDTYYNAPEDMRQALTQQLWRSNYSAADRDVIQALHVKLYEQKLDGREHITLLSSTEVLRAVEADAKVALTLRDKLADRERRIEVDGVILATGFRNLGAGDNHEAFHPLLADIAGHLRRHGDGALHVRRDYRVAGRDAAVPPLFINGLCESSHGFGDAGSFSLLSLRSWQIACSIRDALAGGAPVEKELADA